MTLSNSRIGIPLGPKKLIPNSEFILRNLRGLGIVPDYYFEHMLIIEEKVKVVKVKKGRTMQYGL
jgi:hypothetical protein